VFAWYASGVTVTLKLLAVAFRSKPHLPVSVYAGMISVPMKRSCTKNRKAAMIHFDVSASYTCTWELRKPHTFKPIYTPFLMR